jgi:hypothetical protein
MLMDTGLEGVDDAELDAELGTELDLDEDAERICDRVSVHGGVTDENVVFDVYMGVFEIGVLLFFGWSIGDSFCIGVLLGCSM